MGEAARNSDLEVSRAVNDTSIYHRFQRSLMGAEQSRYAFPTLAEYAARLGEVDGLSYSQARAAEKALTSTLSELLDNDFPARAGRDGHPLLWSLVNQTAWTRLELIALAEDIEATRGRNGFERFLLGLRAADRFSESRAVLRVGAALLGVGYGVTGEIAFAIGGRTKYPDLAVQRPGGELAFTIELKQLRMTEESRWAQEVTQNICLVLFSSPSGTVWGGVVRRLPSPPRLQQIVASISRAQLRLPTSGYEAVEIEGVVSLALASSESDVRFARFSQLHECSAGMILGPDLRSSESQRIVSALKTKRHQCAKSVPSLVMIQCSPTPLMSRALPNLVADLREVLGAHGAIAGGIVFGSHLGAPTEKSTTWGDAQYVCRTRSDVVVEHMLFVPNPFATCSLPKADWSRLTQAFLRRQNP